MTQAGEDKELVIGNKQLISLFFVVVALCGVFFAMGYMIGRNSSKSTMAADASPLASTPSGQRQQPEPPRETALPTPDPGSQTQDQSLTQPAASSAPEPVASSAETRPAVETPRSEEVSRAPAPAPSSASPRVSIPEAGASYLQVTALPRPDADGVVKTLREQSFPTILATSSKEGLYRVLVGPYHQTSQLADAKARLKTIGFGSAFVQKQ